MQKRPKHYWRDRQRRWRAEHPGQDAAYFAKHYAQNKDAILAAQTSRRAELRAACRCEDCGRRRPKDLAAYCRKCQDQRNRRHK